MQLFTFGHPCEHQLRRVCIGGTSCPLNGYPDHWCCSFVKGRINFKRDKPCEGTRCRWGFAHPPAASFDAVTLVLQEGRACAARMEEGFGTGSLHGGPYNITSPHPADVAHCALNMLRVPAARVAPRVGGLLAYAAMKAGDSKVFTQLLKTVKKPVDDYLVGAYSFLTAVRSGATKEKTPSKAELATADELRHDILPIMQSALSQQGALINRDEQLPLQTHFIAALRTSTRNKKRMTEILETAVAVFPKASSASSPALPHVWTKASGGSAVEKDVATSDASASVGHETAAAAPAEAKKASPTKQDHVAATASDKKSTNGGAKSSAVVTAGTRGQASPAARPATPVRSTSAAAESASSTPQVEIASLLDACKAVGSQQDFSAFNDFPEFWGSEPPRGAIGSMPIIGGMFALPFPPVVPASSGHHSTGTRSRSSSVDSATRELFDVPLGPIVPEGQTFALWRDQAEQLARDEGDADRRAELQAAAAALAAADVVLGSLQ